MFVYLDNGATTRQLPELESELLKLGSEIYGNPSSLHKMGLRAEQLVKNAREKIAFSLSCLPGEVFFTAGGTEADNLALFGYYEANKRRGNKIITSKGEHSGILEPCKILESRGVEVVYLDIDEYGNINLDQLEAVVDERTVLISVIYVNNELGTIAPVKEIKDILKRKNPHGAFHSDGVQAFGKIPVVLEDEGPDMISISGHKFHGPKGIGALAVKKELKINPVIYGGGQEKGLRSGTENVPGIFAFGFAAEKAMENRQKNMENIKGLRDYLCKGIKEEIPDIRINTPMENSCPSILNISFSGCPGEVLLHSLEEKDIYVSTGAACSSKKGGSRILRAAGLPDDIVAGAIRFSFGIFNTMEEMDYTVGELKKSVASIRKITKRK